MRIALYHNLTSGGCKREAYEYTKQFVAHGHTVDLFRPATADESFLPLAGLVRSEYVEPLAFRGGITGRLPGLRRYLDLGVLLGNIRRLDVAARSLAARIDGGGYDFAFLHYDAIVQAPQIARYLRTPFVYYCHEPYRRFYEPTVSRPAVRSLSTITRLQSKWYRPALWLDGQIIRAVDRRNALRAQHLFTNSCFSAEAIYRAYGRRARVCYLAVDHERFCPSITPRGDYVFSVGAVHPLKGHDFLVDALGRIPPAERPPLIIVSDRASDTEATYLSALAARRNVNLEFRTNVSDFELIGLYARARAFVYAAILEPFGLAPLEAMACGRPVVAVGEGGVRESVRHGETGLLTQRDPVEFAAALRSVLRDDRLANDLGRRGRERVLEFWTWEHAYLRFAAQLGSVLPSVAVGVSAPVVGTA